MWRVQGEHTVILVLMGWGTVIYGVGKAFGGKKEKRLETDEDRAMNAAVAQLQQEHAVKK